MSYVPCHTSPLRYGHRAILCRSERRCHLVLNCAMFVCYFTRDWEAISERIRSENLLISSACAGKVAVTTGGGFEMVANDEEEGDGNGDGNRDDEDVLQMVANANDEGDTFTIE